MGEDQRIAALRECANDSAEYSGWVNLAAGALAVIAERDAEVVRLRGGLADACRHIAAVFGPHVQMSLETQADPEGLAEDILILHIHWGVTVDDALEKLAELDERWWREASVLNPGVIIDVV